MNVMAKLFWAGVPTLYLAFSCSDSESPDDGEATGGAGLAPATGGAGGSGDGSGGDDSGDGSGGTDNSTGGDALGGLGGLGGNRQGGRPQIGKACASTDQEAQLTQANLLFVVDRSGSMNCNAPEYTNEACDKPEKQISDQPSKWEETHSAISGALSSLLGAENIHVGLTVFPRQDPIEQCLVSNTPDILIDRLTSDHRDSIDDFLHSVVPNGETPIAGASLTSYAYLSEQLIEGKLEGNTFVVLFTDGQETCNVNEDSTPDTVFNTFLKTKVSDATLFNIRSFVIGAPGSEGARSSLSEIAFEGLTASREACSHGSDKASEGDCHFDMTESTDFVGDLAQALSDISNDKTLSCVFDIPPGKVDLKKVNVTYEPSGGDVVDILRDDSRSCEDGADGWQYSEDLTKIILCGNICEQVQDQDGVVHIVLGCPTVDRIR